MSRAHGAYEYRPGQERMAAAVARVIEAGGRLLVEAGTGTGKTLAYLVPAALSGRRVVISTGTRNLQDQVFRQDLPFLRDRLGLRFSACLIKGRDNYLCRYRLGEFLREPRFEDLGERVWLPRLDEWSRRTTTGDRAEIADLPDPLRLWRDVNARADTCHGARCPEHEACWLTRVRRRAHEAQLLVVNHHLLLADLAVRSAFGAVLPEYDTVIFDEAHLLEEVATLYFGTQVSSGHVEEVAREGERLAAMSGGPARGGGGAAELRRAAEELFGPLRERIGEDAGRRRFEPPERGGPELDVAWKALGGALQGVSLATPPGHEEAGAALAHRVEELRAAFERVLERRDAAFVYGMERRGPASVLLSASPIDVSELLRTRLFEPLHAAVLTSATLTVEGSFDFFAERLGLDDAERAVVESSFDHRRQAVLYLPQQMPEPAEPHFLACALEETERLLEASGGRAFLLFTSLANLRTARDVLGQCRRWPLFVQGEGSKAALVERFRASGCGVLLGTTSFWHGVDVPGPALSVVIVDRLPFDVPSEPLVAARIERIRERGGNPFRDYQLPLAVLELKQGLGRLLRSTTDHGVLAVLDPRISTRRYGRTFLRSLPPYRVVRDLAACAAFLAPREPTAHPGTG